MHLNYSRCASLEEHGCTARSGRINSRAGLLSDTVKRDHDDDAHSRHRFTCLPPNLFILLTRERSRQVHFFFSKDELSSYAEPGIIVCGTTGTFLTFNDCVISTYGASDFDLVLPSVSTRK